MCRFTATTLFLTFFGYILALIFISNMGIYFTYVAVPIIIITGVVHYFCQNKQVDENMKLQ